MTTFAARLSAADEHEIHVVRELEKRAWIAERFGQGQLTERVRALLRDVDTRVRWMPDIVAVKRYNARAVAAFVDAKAGDRWRTTGNHDVEESAVKSAAAWEEFAMCPVHFVFGDSGVLSPRAVLELGRPGPHYGNGSGTKYLLVPRSACSPFDGVFGEPQPRAVT